MEESLDLIAQRDEKIEEEMLLLEDGYNFTENIESVANEIVTSVADYINENKIEMAEYLDIDSVQDYLFKILS
jgi:hypothetical protein